MQGPSEESWLPDRLPAERGPGTGLKLGHQGYQEEEEEEEEFIRIQWIL